MKFKSTGAVRRGKRSLRGDTESFITRAELAARLGKHLRSVSLLMKRRVIPYYKIGRNVRFKWSEVEAQVQKRCKVAAR